MAPKKAAAKPAAKGKDAAKGGKEASPAPSPASSVSDKAAAPDASVDFEAGIMFNRADKSRTGVLTADDFRQLWRDAKTSGGAATVAVDALGGNPLTIGTGGAPGVHFGPGVDPAAMAFEAGKIFAAFDKDKDGLLNKMEFEELIKTHPELTRQVPGLPRGGIMGGMGGMSGMQQSSLSSGGGGALPMEVVSGRLLTHYDETAGVAIPRSAVDNHRAMGNTVTPLLESYRARYDRLRGMLTARLLPKREHLLQLRRQLNNVSAEVTAKRKVIERETMTDAEQIIERLRAVESMRQSAIKHQVLQIEEELETIERIVRRVEQANEDGLYHSATGVLLTSAAPGNTPVETVRAPRAASMVELIQQFADLSSTIERVAVKNVTVQVEFPTDDFPKETQERLEVLSRCDKFVHALSVKDHMLWTALQDKERAEELLHEERALSHEYAQEVASWAEMSQTLSQQVVALKQERDRSDRRIKDLLATMREHGIYYNVAGVSTAASGVGEGRE